VVSVSDHTDSRCRDGHQCRIRRPVEARRRLRDSHEKSLLGLGGYLFLGTLRERRGCDLVEILAGLFRCIEFGKLGQGICNTPI
jgi:hypothetical protein